jgi:cell wall-associated NlpC family hydrolase
VTDRTAFLRAQIGKRWRANGRGPDVFDCWHLARYVERELFGRALPSVNVPSDPGWAWMLETIASHPEHANWVRRPTENGLISATDGALVLMARSQRAAHIGVWLQPEQGVVHCDQTSGVKFEDAATLRASGWRKLMFYEPRQS